VNIAICFAPFACDESLVLQNNSIVVRNGECYHTLVEPCKIPSNLTKWTQNCKMGLSKAVQDGRRLRWYDDEKYLFVLGTNPPNVTQLRGKNEITIQHCIEIDRGNNCGWRANALFWQNILVRLHTQHMRTSKFGRVWWGLVNSYLSYIGTIVATDPTLVLWTGHRFFHIKG
jgi:hypothetical protein